MKRKQSQWVKVRKEAAERDGCACIVCGRPATDVHHIIFRSQCGKDELGNVVCLCRYHHQLAHGEKAKMWRLWFKNYLLARYGDEE